MKLLALLALAWPLAVVAAPVDGELVKRDAVAEPEAAPADFGKYGSYGSYAPPAGGYGSYGSYPPPAGGYASYGTYRRNAEEAAAE